MLFRFSKTRYLSEGGLSGTERTLQGKSSVSGRAGRFGCYNEGFSDSERVFRERAALQRGCRDVSDKESVHKRSRGWKDESFNKEVEMMREREKNE